MTAPPPHPRSMVVQKDRFSMGGNAPHLPDNVMVHKGWFDAVLPEFVKTLERPIKVLHVDCDIYSSTVSIFNNLRPFLVPGTIIIFDELFGYRGYLDNEMLALYEFLLSTDVDVELIGKLKEPILCPTGDNGWQYQAALMRLVKRTR